MILRTKKERKKNICDFIKENSKPVRNIKDIQNSIKNFESQIRKSERLGLSKNDLSINLNATDIIILAGDDDLVAEVIDRKMPDYIYINRLDDHDTSNSKIKIPSCYNQIKKEDYPYFAKDTWKSMEDVELFKK